MDSDLGFDFSFLDMKMFGQLIVCLLLWVQWTKDIIPEKIVKPWALAWSFFFAIVVDFASKGNVWSKIALYGFLVASAAGLGYKALTPKAGENTSNTSK